jgi:hypothetical protein
LTILAAEDFERVKRFRSLVSLAEAAYDHKACMSRDCIRYWCRPVLQARTHLFHSIKRPRQILVDDQSVNWDLFERDLHRLEMLAELGAEI